MYFDRKKIDARFRQMTNDADNWIPTWKDLRDWGNPTRGFFEGEDPKDIRKINHKRILNNKFIRALRTASAGLHSGLTSPSRPWFKLALGDPDLSNFSRVRMWLDDVEKRLYAVFNTSNVYRALPMLYSELLLFGTGAMPVEESFEKIFFCKSLTCGQYCLDVDDHGTVNTFCRHISMSVAQVVSEFGYKNCPVGIRQKYDRDELSTVVIVNQLIEPNDKRIKGLKDAKNKAFRSVYWINGSPDDEALDVGGYDEFPIIAPRWEITKSTDVYGVSPAMYTLGDQKTLQEMERRTLIGLAKMIDPPVVSAGSTDAVNTLPGGQNVYDPNMPNERTITPIYQIQLDFQNIGLAKQQIEQRIDEMLYVDLFRMILDSDQRQPITAREVVERHEEKMMSLGPVLESMNQELHAPLIKRVFSIMMRGGMLPPPPPELDTAILKIEFISILAQAQQMVATTAIQQGLTFIGTVAGLFPQVTDVVDIDQAATDYLHSNGVPEKIIRAKEDIEKIREERNKAQQQAQMAQDMSAMVQGAKTLSETKLDDNTALNALTGYGR